MKFKRDTIQRIILIVGILIGLFSGPIRSVKAAAELTINPITWNVIGLDSNNVSVGPNNFPVGVRACNPVGNSVTFTDVEADFIWQTGGTETTDALIRLRPGSLDPIQPSPAVNLTPGNCYDYYFEVEIERNSSAYDKTRRYKIDITYFDPDTGGIETVSTPTPREIFVERLISQSRNSVTSVEVDDVAIPEGGTMTLMVGQEYKIELIGSTATNGYEQIESFINFPNTIFQVLSVSTAYQNESSVYVENPDDKLYGDGCLWENDPDNPNYRSCLDVGKAGGNITVTYQVKIIQVPSSPLSNPQGLNTLIHDFSGSSYHYNSDFSASTRYANIVNASITKSFTPKAIYPDDSDVLTTDDTSTLSFVITNPGPEPISSVNFIDNFPPGVEIEGTSVAHSGCGPLSPLVLTDGDISVSFSDITVAGFGTCQIDVTVTGPSEGTFLNTTEKLYIGTDDTGSIASDTLLITSSSAVHLCYPCNNGNVDGSTGKHRTSCVYNKSY